MKSTYKIAAAVVGSFVLGVGTANVLHAQAKPPAYLFAEIDVKDQDAHTKDYLPKGARQHRSIWWQAHRWRLQRKADQLQGKQRRPTAWCSCNSQIWTRSRRSRRKSRSFRRTLGSINHASYRVIGIEGVEQK